MKKYSDLLKSGREIVVIDNTNEYCDSAIFWYSNYEKCYYSFNRSMGILERPDMTDDRFNQHMENMKKEDASIFVRGYRD